MVVVDDERGWAVGCGRPRWVVHKEKREEKRREGKREEKKKKKSKKDVDPTTVDI